MKFTDRYPGIRTALEASGVTLKDLHGFRDRIFETYGALAGAMHDSMGWKTKKPEHARECAAEIDKLASRLGLDSEEERAFYALLSAGHDLGRMVEGLRKSLDPKAPKKIQIILPDGFADRWPLVKEPKRDHGLDSAELLRLILGWFAETLIGQWSLLAVEHHSDIHNPTLDMVGGILEALALCNFLRDVDKVTGFDDALRYTQDEAHKATQRLQNWAEQIVDDAAWGTEMGRIDPAEAIDDFVAGIAINRAKCRSWEAYMLQYLTWIISIVLEEMREIALARGGPQIVAAYLLRQLLGNHAQYSRLHNFLENWRGGILLRPAPAA